VIALRNVVKRYGVAVALDGVSLDIQRGEFVVLVGPSGSGKSTLLKTINRLVEIDSGEIDFLGTPIRQLRPEDLRRRMGYAIQSTGLFPHWTVARNIATVPRLLGWPAARIAQRVDELLALLALDPATFRERYPQQLSGGQQQRVGVARALAADPEVLLMDEPFGALDNVTRLALQQALADIQRRTGKTVLMVTHDILEALRLASRIVLLDHGRIVQSGSPVELLRAPAGDFVSDFIGGGELGLRRLAQQRVADHLRPGAPPSSGGMPLAAENNLRDALSAFVEQACDRLDVVDADGRRVGVLHLADVLPGTVSGPAPGPG
jgi:osmoprotectant transport system ATP-binding protein